MQGELSTYSSKLQKLGVLDNSERQCFVMPLTTYLGKITIGQNYLNNQDNQ
jgi:hypothetical protein